MKRTFPERAIHLDFHTMPGVYDVGENFDAEQFVGTLKNADVDYITVFARCNLGFSYYPTRIGIPHPGLKKKDLLGEMISACRNAGIRAAAYFNAGLDHEHALRHREWCKVNSEGQVAEIQNMGHSFRKMCLNTSYRQHLLGMIEEIVSMYPVDGIFLDCFYLSPCYGIECVDGMRKSGMDMNDENEAKDFCWMITRSFMEEAVSLVKAKKKDAYMYFNGLPYTKQPTHLELEILPTGQCGYDYLPWIIRYARTLKKPYFVMTGRFHKSWGDFGGLKSEHSLLFDLYSSIANCGTCSIGDHMHPRGELDAAVYDSVGRVYSRVKKLENFTKNARPVTDMAVIEPALSMFPGFSFDSSSVAGAARMLSELKCQFNVIDGSGDISGYRIIILPDKVSVDSGMKKKLEKHLKGGGILVSSAFAGLNAGREAFALEEYKILFEGDEENNPSFFRAEKEISAGLPDMLTAVYEQGASIKALKGAHVLARLFKPYFNIRSWDWRHENMYTPPEKDTGRPALVRCGNIFHFSFPIFQCYFNDALPAYKTLLKNCIEMVFTAPVIKLDNFPSFGQATATRKDNMFIVHLISYLPELRGKRMQVIEEPIRVSDVLLSVRKDSIAVKKACLAPYMERLDFEDRDGYIQVKVPEVKGYQMVVFES